jgi:cytochrome c
LVLFVGIALLFSQTIRSQTIRQRSHDVKNGERLYKSGCITCHGADGRGAPETLTEFQRPDTFPDFTLFANHAGFRRTAYVGPNR